MSWSDRLVAAAQTALGALAAIGLIAASMAAVWFAPPGRWVAVATAATFALLFVAIALRSHAKLDT